MIRSNKRCSKGKDFEIEEAQRIVEARGYDKYDDYASVMMHFVSDGAIVPCSMQG